MGKIDKGSKRDRYSKWSFGELRNFVTYKAKNEGVPLKIVSSKNTSRQCPECEYIDQRNRKSRNAFNVAIRKWRTMLQQRILLPRLGLQSIRLL